MSIENTQYEVAEIEPVGLAEHDVWVYTITVRPAFVPTVAFLRIVCETTAAEHGVSAEHIVSTMSATRLQVKIKRSDASVDEALSPEEQDLLDEGAQHHRAQLFADDLCADLNEIEHMEPKKAPRSKA